MSAALIEHAVSVAVTDTATRLPLLPVAGSLLYNPEWDPWTVELWAMASVRWPLSRDLIACGQHTPIGTDAGGVEIAPEYGGRVLRLRLPAPAAGQVELRLSGVAVTRFLHFTYCAVPSGAEADCVDLDDLAARLETPR